MALCRCILLRRQSFESEGVDGPSQQLCERGVDCALSLEPRAPGEGRGDHGYAKMGLPFRACACMPAVQMRFVDNLEARRRKPLLQRLSN